MEAPDRCCNCSNDDNEMYDRQRERERYWASPEGILRRKQLDEQEAIEAESRRPKWIENPDEDYMERYNLQNRPWMIRKQSNAPE